MSKKELKAPEQETDFISICENIFNTFKYFSIDRLNDSIAKAVWLNNEKGVASKKIFMEGRVSSEPVKFKNYELLPVSILAYEEDNEAIKIELPLNNEIINLFTDSVKSAGFSGLGFNNSKDYLLKLKYDKFEILKNKYTEDFVIKIGDRILGLCFNYVTENSVLVSVLEDDKIFIFSTDSYWHSFSEPSHKDETFYVNTLDTPLTCDDILKANYADALLEHIDNFKSNQDDPFLDLDSLEDQPLEFLSGSEEELEEQLTLLFHACIPGHLWEQVGLSDIGIDVRASYAEEPACVDFENMEWNGSEFTRLVNNNSKIVDIDAFKDALDKVVECNEPQGYTWEYNDGSYDRQSGYDQHAARLGINITAPTAHEHICAKLKLKEMNHIFSKSLIKTLLKDADN